MADHVNAGQMPGNSYTPRGQGLGKPVDRSQERFRPSPHYPRTVPPRTDAGDDEKRSLTSQVLTYGGAAIAAAAVTAGAVLTVRKVVELVTGDDDDPRDARRGDRPRPHGRPAHHDHQGRGPVPRFAGQGDMNRGERMRGDSPQAPAYGRPPRPPRPFDADRPQGRPDAGRPDDDRRPRQPYAAPPRRGDSLGLVGDIEHTAQSLSRNINGVVGSVTAAMAAFRTVADQAEGVVRQFHGTADAIRGFLDNPNRQRVDGGRDFRRPARRDVVDLRDSQPQPDQPRAHRL